MNLIQSIIKEYPSSPAVSLNLVRQYLQEIVLSGMFRSNFFGYSAFQGGTCLRIFHGLDRFSEDLDFCVVQDGHKVDLDSISGYIQNEIESFGLHFEIQKRDKEGGNICGFQIKGNTVDVLETMGFPDSIITAVHPKTLTYIKVDIDKETPKGFGIEHQYKTYPFHYGATLMDLPSLFAGKTSAVITRYWKKRVKGRDLYDFDWYIKKGIPINMSFLESNLMREGLVNESELNMDVLLSILEDRFNAINYDSALEDIALFVQDEKIPEEWGPEYFINLSKKMMIDGQRQR